MPPPPLPAAVPPVAVPPTESVRVVSDRAKLPPDIATLVDPAAPLPAGVQFFEKRVTLGNVFAAAAWSIALAGLGLLSLLIGIAILLDRDSYSTPGTPHSGPTLWPIFFAFTCGIGSWVMIDHARTALRLRGDQQNGRPTRLGLLLTPTTLIEASETSWTILPRGQARPAGDGTVRYDINGKPKTLRLPADVIGGDRAGVERAIMLWQ